MATVNMDVLRSTDVSRGGEVVSADARDAPDRGRKVAPPPVDVPDDDPAAENASAESDSSATDFPATDSLAGAVDACGDGALLARQHQREIWRYLRFLGCDAAQAEDVVQETFLAVLKRPPECVDAAAVRAYLRTVARNLFLAQLRKTSREAEFDLDAAEQLWAETHPRDGGDQRLVALDDCLATLEGRARQAIDLAYRENQSRAEIAAALEMTEDGVKSLLRRTRDVLRQCVERKVNASGE